MLNKENKEKLNSLEEIVKELEESNVDLEDAINRYTEAMKIAKECSEKLDNAPKAVNKILTENGELENLKKWKYKSSIDNYSFLFIIFFIKRKCCK